MKKENLKIVRQIPGRVRLRFDPNKKDIPNLDTYLEVHGVEQVVFSKLTKSLLIVYDQKIPSKEIFIAIKRKMPYLNILRLQPKKQSELGDAALPQVLNLAAQQLNNKVNLATNGYADATSLAGAGLFLWGFEELLRKPVMPKWYDIMRSSQSFFNLMEIEKVGEEIEEIGEEMEEEVGEMKKEVKEIGEEVEEVGEDIEKVEEKVGKLKK